MRKNAPVWFGGREGKSVIAVPRQLPGIEAAREEFVIMGLRCFGVPLPPRGGFFLWFVRFGVQSRLPGK